jgi:hypothetical protein
MTSKSIEEQKVNEATKSAEEHDTHELRALYYRSKSRPGLCIRKI